MRLALLMFCARFRSSSRFITNGLNNSNAMFFGRPHWCSFNWDQPRSPNDRSSQRAYQEGSAEPALLALEHVRSTSTAGFRAGHRTPTASVVEQGVDGSLKHPLLVVHDDLRSTEVEQSLQAVVPVDHATVQVVEIGGGKTCHRPTAPSAAGPAESPARRPHHAGGLLVVLRKAVTTFNRFRHGSCAAPYRSGWSVAATRPRPPGRRSEPTFDRLGTHETLEVLTEPALHLAVAISSPSRSCTLSPEPLPHGLEAVQFALPAVPDLLDLTLASLAHLSSSGRPWRPLPRAQRRPPRSSAGASRCQSSSEPRSASAHIDLPPKRPGRGGGSCRQ